MQIKIGANIKNIRKNKKLTIQELSEMTGLSIGFLSQVERDINSPTIKNLQKICQALDLDITQLLAENNKGNICVRKNERRSLFTYDEHLQYDLTSENGWGISGVMVTVTKNNDLNESYRHMSDEHLLLLEGTLEVEVGDATYVLNEGDSLYIEAGCYHSFKSLSDKCVFHSVLNEAIHRSNAPM